MTDTDPTTTSESMTDTDTDTDPGTSSSSTGSGDSTYPACDFDADPVCAEPYTGCYSGSSKEFSVCTIECEMADECPAPADGDAVPACGGPGMNECVLDCAGKAACPTGMDCVEIFMGINRCMWPAA